MCKYCDHIEEKHFSSPKFGNLRVWWIPQVPMKSFVYPVETIKEAKRVLDMLAQYDLFQLEHRVKPDYANVGGLQIYGYDGETEKSMSWIDWYNDDGEEIDDVDENGNSLEQ